MDSFTKVSKQSVSKALKWSFAAEFAAKIIVPITNMILARILVPEAFGIIATINMIVSFADMLSTSGISRFVVQHNFESQDELYRNADVAFWTNIFISSLGWVIITIFSKPLSVLVGNPGYEVPLIISALSLPLNAFSSVQEGIYQRDLHYKKLFYLRLVVSFVPFIITIPLALLGLGYWALIIGTLTVNLLKIILLSISSPWKPSLFFKISYLKNMFSFCMWMLLVAISSWFITYVDVLLVSNKMGEYYTGLYKNSQTTVVGIISIITAATTSVLFASLSREQDNDNSFKNLLFSFQQKVGMLVIPMGVGIYCFSDLITLLLLGKQWIEASRFIGEWGLSTAIVCVFADFCKEACKAKGKPQLPFYVQILHLFFIIPVCYFNINRGFEDFGFIRAAANLEIIIIYFVFIYIFLKISPFKMLFSLKVPILAAICMGVFGKILLKYLPSNIIMQFLYILLCIIFYFSLICISGSYRVIVKEYLYSIKNKFISKKKEAQA